jgi:hypothetical protein
MKRKGKRGHFTSIWIIVTALLFLAGTTSGSPSILLLSLNQTYVSLAPGHTTYIGYTVTLTNGTAWPTSIYVSEPVNYSQAGIGINIVPNGGIPPFSGTATISVSNPKAVGTFSIVMLATMVNQTSPPVALLVTVTPQLHTNATAPISGKNQPNSNLLYVATIAVVIIVIAVLVTIRLAKRRPKVGGGNYSGPTSISSERSQNEETDVGEIRSIPDKTQ